MNLIVPGYIAGTEMSRPLPQEVHNAFIAETASGRAGTPADFAFLVR